jgi:hypothetical protein
MTKKERFIESFEEAIKIGARYVFTEMWINGYPASEIIVNPIENAQLKLDYICKVYDDNLCMVKNENGNGLKVVEIISFGYIENLSQLEYARNNSEVN